MKEERSEENLEALKKLIQDDIIGSINDNLKLGNITADMLNAVIFWHHQL